MKAENEGKDVAMIDGEGTVVAGEVELPAGEQKKKKKRKSEAVEVSCLELNYCFSRTLTQPLIMNNRSRERQRLLRARRRRVKRPRRTLRYAYFRLHNLN